MIRELIEKLTGVVAERSHSARKKFSVPVRITFDPIKTTGNLSRAYDGLYITGESNDLSKSGVSFVVPSIRIKEFYLVGQERKLKVELDIPGGKVRMKVIGRRYEKVGIHLSTEKYLVGAEITDIGRTDRERYEYFLKYGGKSTKSASPSYEMGID
jgi:hypothetical protein